MVKTKFIGLIALVTLLGGPALAVDGVIEINQARALAGGVSSGDAAGFPVSLNSRATYRLTSDLNVPLSTDGIYVDVDDVTIDLNGFNIVSSGGAFHDGINANIVKNLEVRNGTIRGFGRSAVFQVLPSQGWRLIGVRAISNGVLGFELEGTVNLIRHCFAQGHSSIGFRTGDGSLVEESIARSNGDVGLLMLGSVGYRGNVFTGNNGGDANPQVSGGLQLGSNVCGTDLVCP